MEQELISRQTIDSMVASYNHAVAKIEEGYDALGEARDTMNLAFGASELWFTMASTLADKRHQVRKELLIASWKYVVEQTGVKNVMTEARTKELTEQFKKGDVPEFTVEAVTSMIQNLRGDVGTLLDESVKEVFEWLRPRVVGNRERFKTNSEYEVGKKAILTYIFTVWSGSWGSDLQFNEDSQVLTGIDNVFHLLDGNGVAKHPKDLKTVVKYAHNKGEMDCETEYFKCKWHKKGTFHIEFKRLDLVAELNRVAGGNRLKCAEA